ncbi:MAG: MFS transporter [Ignavibacteriales bacterium]|nr:MAG: MFS transporter [Ignavibacteriales bacterium]
MSKEKPTSRNPWSWIPTLYYAEGIPYIVVMTVSVIMYKRLGISNAEIALYTSWLYLPWVIKPLWSPVVDLLGTKRFWIVLMQLIIGAGLGGVALTIPVPSFFQYTLVFFWLLAFSSATHDIAADGFYMLGLSKHDQAWFVGIRNTFYRLASITGQGLLIILAGYLESTSGLQPVEINVNSKPGQQASQFLSPSEINFEDQAGEMRFLTYPDELNISTNQRSKSEVDSIIKFAREWNISHHFYQAEVQLTEEDDEPSWWDKNIVQNLESFLRENFGPEGKTILQKDLAGNIGVVYLKLSTTPEPGNEVVLNFSRGSGDNSISTAEGSRFVFNSENWDTPAIAVIQLDPKLKVESSAAFEGLSGDIPFAWMVTFFIMGGLFVLFFVYHKFMLPYPAADKSVVSEGSIRNVLKEFFRTFALFFKKKQIGLVLAFILLYRLGEAQLVKLATPFLLDPYEAGGLSLTTGQIGFVYGTIGITSLTIGGIIGGLLAAKNGLKYWIWWMIIAINLPDLVYVYLSYTQTTNFLVINLMVAIEQFGYGFGFTAFMLYLIYVSEGDHKTSHYAIATGFMALGMMIPGMFSGWLQEIIGYQHFFIWVCIATIPGFIVTKYLKIDPEFGKKSDK